MMCLQEPFCQVSVSSISGVFPFSGYLLTEGHRVTTLRPGVYDLTYSRFLGDCPDLSSQPECEPDSGNRHLFESNYELEST